MDSTIRSLLRQTFDEITYRSQIEEYGRELVGDVELSFTLEEKLLFRRQVASLQRCVLEQKQIIDETCAVLEDDRRRYRNLARRVTIELWNMSQELCSLTLVKDQYSTLLQKHEELLATVLISEEKFAERSKSPDNLTNTMKDKLVSSLTQQNKLTKPVTPYGMGQKNNFTSTDLSDSPKVFVVQPNILHTSSASSDPLEAIQVQFGESDSRCWETPACSMNVKNAGALELLNNGSEKSSTLDNLETSLLLHIFLYLDPLDVLNTAQVNIAMYNRVDILFNPGANDDSDHIAVSKDSATVTDNENSKSMQSHPNVSVSSIDSAIPRPVSTSSIDLDANVVPLSSTDNRTRHTGSNYATSNVSSVESNLIVPGSFASSPASRDNFSFLQPIQKDGGSSFRRSADLKLPTQQPQDNQSYQLNAAMASSMAAKLSDTELNAIILMTDRLKRKEDLAAQYKREQDALIAKLEGTESVKQFLIGKVRDMEQALNSSFNSELIAAQQAESDQEVIAYLDGRVQELEREYRLLRSETKRAMLDKDTGMKKLNEKTIVMGDMLQFERQKFFEREREWKVTKKVLVKEVKSLRAQVVSLQKDHDIFS